MLALEPGSALAMEQPLDPSRTAAPSKRCTLNEARAWRELASALDQRCVLHVARGVGHSERAGMHRAVRSFLCRWLKGETQAACVEAVLMRSAVGALTRAQMGQGQETTAAAGRALGGASTRRDQ